MSRKLTMTKRFYIGSQDMATHFASTGKTADNMGLLQEKLDEAAALMESHPTRECMFIVEVVKVVRRQPRPVIVESTR